MLKTEENKQSFRQTRRKLIPNLFINLLLPWLLYLVLRPHFTNDTLPLAISSIIPAFKTLVQWGLRRRVDWLGVISIVILAIAFIATFLSGGSALPIKLIQPAIFGVIGLIFLVSVLVGKPLLLTIHHLLGRHQNDPMMHKKLTAMSALFGGIAFIGSMVHIVMALLLPTRSYLAMSSMVSVGTIVALIVCAKLIAPRIK